MNLYKTRLALGISDEERQKLVFEETIELVNEVDNKAYKTAAKSKWFNWLNTALNLTIVISSAVIVVITAINDFQNVTAIVLGGIIFAISGSNELLKLGPRGYFYMQGTVRLRRIRQQIRELIYLFHTFSSEEILAFLSSFRTEVDEIDLELYKSSMSGDAKFGNSLRIQSNDSPLTPRKNNSDNEIGHIHIHLDTPNTSPESPLKSHTTEVEIEEMV